MNKKIVQIAFEDDELVAERRAEEALDEPIIRKLGHPQYPHRDALQFNIERATLDFCLRNKNPLTYGTVLDALYHFTHEKTLDEGFYTALPASRAFLGASAGRIRQFAIDFSKEIEDAALQTISERQINSKDALDSLGEIYGRYRRLCAHGHVRKWGGINNKTAAASSTAERHPYSLRWTPWFNKLREAYNQSGLSSLKSSLPYPYDSSSHS